MEGKA